jgi:hypothetical protein
MSPSGRSSRSARTFVDRLRDNGLLLACLGLFLLFFIGMVISGAATYNEEQREHGSSEQVSTRQYLGTGDFVEATFENWESEFLQMGMYVVLTAFLYQRGSSESKPIDDRAPQDADPQPWFTVAGAARRLATHALRTFLGDSAFRAFLRLTWFARHRRGEGVQRGTDSTRPGRNLGVALPQHVTILV